MERPKYIVKVVRQRLDLNENDNSRDATIGRMSNDEIFEHLCEWEGLIGYADKIKRWVKDVYGITLSDADTMEQEMIRRLQKTFEKCPFQRKR